MRRISSYIIALLLIIIIFAGGWIYLSGRNRKAVVEVRPGAISSVESMVRLCSMEFCNEVPVLDTINNKVMFAVQKQTGSISFDVEHLEVDLSGDTIHVVLPAEIIELRESTDKDSWEVIDTKAVGPMAMLRSDKFSLEEENAVKSHIKANSVRQLYDNGIVSRARREAARNLQRLLQTAWRKPVTVIDTVSS